MMLATTQEQEARPRAIVPAHADATSLSIAVAGSGGSGVMTAGSLLLEAAGKAGFYGLMVRTPAFQ